MMINKTTNYFNITEKEAGRRINEYDTKEEALVLDACLQHYFFETLEGLKDEYDSIRRKKYTKERSYDVLLFEFVADNENHNKYCMGFI